MGTHMGLLMVSAPWGPYPMPQLLRLQVFMIQLSIRASIFSLPDVLLREQRLEKPGPDSAAGDTLEGSRRGWSWDCLMASVIAETSFQMGLVGPVMWKQDPLFAATPSLCRLMGLAFRKPE